MVYAAVALVGALCVANLFLIFMVIHWARRQFERLATRPGAGLAPRLPAGSRAPEFEATTVSGMRCSLADLTGARSAVAFFSVGCTPCHTQLPEFVAYARTIPGGASQVVAVVAGDGEHEREAAARFTDELRAVASVVVEPRQGPLAAAFSVQGFPTFYALDESGRIESGGAVVRMISVPRQLA